MDLQKTLSTLDRLGLEYAFYFRRPGNPSVFKSNCARFSSASIIKVPILLAWVHLERAGLLDRTEICNLDSEPQVQGAGLAWLLHSRRIPYADVLLLMIALSDNLCTNLIIQRIGLQRLQTVFTETLGLTGTQCQRKLMDYAARERGLDNWISAEDCVRFYDLIRALEPEERTWVESLLAANIDNALLLRDIPRDTLDFYHKTGSMTGVLHDWGYTRSAEMFLLTQNVSAEPPVFAIFGELGRLLAEP
jgi:beta-lactamase class A